MKQCPHCTNSDPSLIEEIYWGKQLVAYLCSVCGKTWKYLNQTEK